MSAFKAFYPAGTFVIVTQKSGRSLIAVSDGEGYAHVPSKRFGAYKHPSLCSGPDTFNSEKWEALTVENVGSIPSWISTPAGER